MKKIFPAMFVFILSALVLSVEASELSKLPAISEDAVRVFIVRHGETFHNADSSIPESSEKYNQLTEKGIAQSKSIGEVLQDQPIVAAYASETERTLKTLELSGIPDAKNINAKQDSAFNKVTLGETEDGDPLSIGYRIHMWESGQDPSPKKGESMAEAMDRVFSRIQEEDDALGKAIVVVTHSDIIAGAAGTTVNVPPYECWERFGSSTGSITVVDVYQNGAKCLWAFNVVPLGDN